MFEPDDPFYAGGADTGGACADGSVTAMPLPNQAPSGNGAPPGFHPDAAPPFEDATLRHGPKDFTVIVLKNVRFHFHNSPFWHNVVNR